MIRSLIDVPAVRALERGLDALTLRQQVLANNIANVDTPGFKRADVSFRAQLEQALASSPPSPGQLSVTHRRHIRPSLPPAVTGTPQVVVEEGSLGRLDGNNVDIDLEMTLLAQNALWYQATAQQLGRMLAMWRAAITEGGR